MCNDCGCGLPGETPTGIKRVGVGKDHAHAPEHGHSHAHDHAHDHEHHHSHSHAHRHGGVVDEHDHTHEHSHGPAGVEEGRRTVEIRRAILEKNDRLAERNRGYFRARGLLVLNVLSSPGSGKTTFLRETIRGLGGSVKAGVIVGDLATDNDAQRLRESGVPVVQITTGTVCHLEAEMVARAVKQLGECDLQLLIIENVGNLVCPASYDLGEDLRVVLLSVTEGEDKPLKYPPMFQLADVVIISKIDLAQAVGFDGEALRSNLRRVSPRAKVFEVSARTGQGMDHWREFLVETQKQQAARDPL